MIRIQRFLTRFALVVMTLIIGTMDTVPVFAAPVDPTDNHKGDLYYYTFNGIYFYEGGLVHCGNGQVTVGGAAGVLQAQSNLDKRWVTLILTEANKAGADPIAMASLLFWEHRGFPEYGAGPSPGESDSVGRGPWQIVAGTWPSSAGPYATNVYDPVISTQVAADYVKRNGGSAGSPIGSIDQDFSRGANLPSMATVAKNYNAGQATWREPAVAGYRQAGRSWLSPTKNWDDVKIGDNLTKSDVIDDYILGMTFAYYTMATNTAQLSKGGGTNTADFVGAALRNADKIKNFKFGDDGTQSGSNVANTCGTGEGNGNIAQTAFGLAWPNRKFNHNDAKSFAKPSYQEAMPRIQGEGTANSINTSDRCPGCTAWTDCGVFVATTMRLSGADPEYQKRGTGLQLPYLRANGNPSDPNRKYDIIEGKKDTNGLLPGDIFIVSGGGVGHTFIFVGEYTGDDGKKYDSLSASWGQRVPMAANSYFDQGGYDYVIARPRAAAVAPTTPTTGGTQP